MSANLALRRVTWPGLSAPSHHWTESDKEREKYFISCQHFPTWPAWYSPVLLQIAKHFYQDYSYPSLSAGDLFSRDNLSKIYLYYGRYKYFPVVRMLFT